MNDQLIREVIGLQRNLNRTAVSETPLPGSGGGAPVDATYVVLDVDATLTQERVLTGTSDQITITDNGAGGTVVISTPQNINVTSNVIFGSASVGALTASSTVTFSGLAAGSTNSVLTLEAANVIGSRAIDSRAWSGGGLVDGSGSSGRVAFWTGASTLGSNTNFQYNGSQLQLANTTTSGGILIGGDVQLYRSQANVLGIPDSVSIAGTLFVGGSTVWISGSATVGIIQHVGTIATASEMFVTAIGDAVSVPTATVRLTASQLAGDFISMALVLDTAGNDTVTFTNVDVFTFGTYSTFGSSEAVFNDPGADIDFRIEGDNASNLFFVDAGNDRFTSTISNTTTTPQFGLIQDSTGDVAMRFAIGSTTSWAFGIDNSDSDSLVWSTAASGTAVLGTGNLMRLSTAGQLSLPTSGSGAGLLLGGDVLLYRASADMLRTSDSFRVDVALGIAADGGSGGQVYSNQNATNTSIINGRFDQVHTVTSSAAYNTYALRGQVVPVISSGVNDSGYTMGLQFAAYRISASDQGTKNEIRAIWTEVGHVSGIGAGAVTTSQYGLLIQQYATGTASSSIGTAYGVSIATAGSTTPITTYYGLHIVPMTATTTYAIYTTTGTLSFGGTAASLIGFRGKTPVAAPDYTINNPTTQRTLDVSGASIGTVRQVLGTLLQDLIDVGLLQ